MGFSHNSYNWIDKSPVIDQLRTLMSDNGITPKMIENKKGVCVNTMRRWFNGKTRRPQAPTLDMVASYFGMELGLTEKTRRRR